MRAAKILAGIVVALMALTSCVDTLSEANFEKYWYVEAEDDSTEVTWGSGYVEFTAPKGLTVWRREKMKGDIRIEYEAEVVVEREGDRLSDMNCFWKATDPESPDDIFATTGRRRGIFKNYYSLSLYYVGYGGNQNRTTRFRKYTADTLGIGDPAMRPEILMEYRDIQHLLQPNHWYRIEIECRGQKTTMSVDGQQIVDYVDLEPLREGWFAFRTTKSRTRMRNFSVTELKE